jgi:hypothetical protein
MPSSAASPMPSQGSTLLPDWGVGGHEGMLCAVWSIGEAEHSAASRIEGASAFHAHTFGGVT